MPLYEIRYEKPPHCVGFQHVRCADDFDADILAEELHGDSVVYVRAIMEGDITYVESRDQIFRRAGRAPEWLRKIGYGLGITTDPRQG